MMHKPGSCNGVSYFRSYLLACVCLSVACPSVASAADFNITDFGAVSGGGNDLVAIQNAINAASAGDRVIIPAGTFQINGAIVPKAGISIVGAGKDLSVIEYTGSSTSVMIELSGSTNNVELAGFTLDGNNSTKASHGIRGGGSYGHYIHDMRIENFVKSSDWSTQGIYFYSNVDNTRIEQNEFRNIGLNAEFGSAIRISDGSSFNTIIGNDIQNTGRGGINIANNSTDNIIRANTITGSGQYTGPNSLALGLEIWRGCDRTIIEDNVVDHWLSVDQSDLVAVRRNTVLATDGMVAYAGIEVAGGSDGIYTHNNVGRGGHIGLAIATFNEGSNKQRIYVANNTFSDSETWGAQLQDSEHPVGQIYFYDNVFERAENDGDELYNSVTAAMRILSLSGGQGIEDIVFDSNRFINNDETAIQIINNQHIDQLEFINNIITGNGGSAVTGGGLANAKWQANTVSGNGTNNALPNSGFANAAPNVSIDLDSNSFDVGEMINFAYLYSDDNSASPADVLWDFGQGLPEVGHNPSHAYDQPGVYGVTLLVWDTQGRAARAYMELLIGLNSLTGDLDGDGFVGISDLNIVLGAWNQSVPPGNALADPSGDGFVGIEDLNIVLGNWNAGSPPTTGGAIPEPASAALLAALILGLSRPRCIGA